MAFFVKRSSFQNRVSKFMPKKFYEIDPRLYLVHRHLRNIDCLTARVFFISTVNSRSKKRRKEAYYELC
jgi:hypothetical protein